MSELELARMAMEDENFAVFAGTCIMLLAVLGVSICLAKAFTAEKFW